MANKYLSLEGGLDLETPPIEAKAGTCTEALNFFEAVKGGYTSLLGYERFDGQPAPSEASYVYIIIEDYDLKAGAVNDDVGQVVVIDTLTFTVGYREIKGDGTEAILIGTEATGVIPAEEGFPIAYDTSASCTVMTSQGAGETDWETGDVTSYLTITQDLRRDAITVVPGSGPIRGVAQIRGEKIAWRDNTSTTACNAFKSTPTGWEIIPEVAIYTSTLNGGGDIPTAGDMFNGGNDQYIDGGTWLDDDGVSDPLKHLFMIKRIAGSIPTEFIRDSDGLNMGTRGGTVNWSQEAGGSVQYINHNFYAGLDTYNMYFCDGENVAMAYEPQYNVIRPISANLRTMEERCTYPFAHNSRLFMSTTGGTFITSVVGEPTVLDGTLDSAEFGIGDEITGFAATSSESLAIYTRNQTFGFTGRGTEDWRLDPISSNSGARAGCIAQTDDVFASDDRGIGVLSKSDKLGGFEASTITDDVQRLFKTVHNNATCATTLRKLNQMRFYYGTRMLILSRVPYNANGREGTRYGITEGLYDVPVLNVSTEEDTDGVEHTFFGSDDGYVYKADSGSSSDGAEMEFVLTQHFNHFGSPLMRKRFTGIDFEAIVTAPTTFQIYYYMNDGQKTFEPRNIGFAGGISQWDVGLFDTAIYDAIPLTRPRMTLRGTGYNIQFSFYRSSLHEPQATLTGYAIRLKDRGLVAI